MQSINRTMFVGEVKTLGEVKQLQSGTSLAEFTLETTEEWNENKKYHEIKLKAFGKAALVAQEISPGDWVIVEGKVTSSKYTGKDGIERTGQELIAMSVIRIPIGKKSFAEMAREQMRLDQEIPF